jgi:hypothetical protein
MVGDWRQLHIEQLHNLYSSPDSIKMIKSRMMGWPGHVAHMGEEAIKCRGFVGNSEGNRPLGKPRRRWLML